MKAGISVFFLVLISLASCSWFSEPFIVRISIISDSVAPPAVKVFVEGPDGNALTGAMVTLRSPDGTAEIVGFNSDEGCYIGSAGSRRSGIWEAEVRSVLSDKETKYAVEHRVLSDSAAITQVMDANGHTGSSAAALDAQTDIAVAWNEVSGATAYQITTAKGTSLVYAGTSSAAAHIIPAGSLPATSSLLIMVSARWQAGDPLYETANYCSASSADGEPYRVVTE